MVTPTIEPYKIKDIADASKNVITKVSEGNLDGAVSEFYTAYVRAVNKDDRAYTPNSDDLALAKEDPRFRDFVKTLKSEAAAITRYSGVSKKLAQRLFVVTKSERLKDGLEDALLRELLTPIEEP